MANVPRAPGVPQLSAFSAVAAAEVLTADAVSVLAGLFLGPQWGIFQNGLPIVLSDNVVSMEYKQEWAVADYQLEQGAFESYDRVQMPFEARVRFSAGGSLVNRLAFLAQFDAITTGAQIYDVVTPEKVYQSVSISHQDFRRTAQDGVGLIKVDIWCTQVRVTATTQFTNTTTPSGSSPVGGGTVQTQPPPPGVGNPPPGIQ